MKKFLIFSLFILLIFPIKVLGKKGCCSSHGGVVGCSLNGKQLCADGTTSPTCTCVPESTYEAIYGCMDSTATNYNSSATIDDGSCQYVIYGCLDKEAINYNDKATESDDSCEYKEIIVKKEPIKYETKEDYLPDEEGEITVSQKGVDGLKEITYEVIKDSHNNIKSETKLEEKITKEPIPEIKVKVKKEATEKEEITEEITSKDTNDYYLSDDNYDAKDMVFNNTPFLCFLVCSIFVLIYHLVTKEEKTLFSRIKKYKALLYIGYFVLVIPVFIDVIISIIEIIKGRK